MRALRIVAIVLLVLIAVVGVGLWVVTGTSFGHERIRRFALSTLQSRVHGTVTLGRIDGNLLTARSPDELPEYCLRLIAMVKANRAIGVR